jgi:hypothetical protein
MPLVPLNRLLSYSFRQIDLAPGYGEGMIKADDALTCNILITLLVVVPAMSAELFRHLGAAKDLGTLEYVFDAGGWNGDDRTCFEPLQRLGGPKRRAFSPPSDVIPGGQQASRSI